MPKRPSPALVHALQTRWAALATREKRLLTAAAVLVLCTALWLLSLGPALSTLRSAPGQSAALQVQMQQMLALRAQAQALQSQPTLPPNEALRALAAATQQTLGNTAQLTVNAERATVTLKDTPADALAPWLAQARLNAHAVPLEARLGRTPGAAGSSNWSGVVVLALPTQP